MARRSSRSPGRIRAFERFLLAGTRITIRVIRPGYIGKYVRIRIPCGRETLAPRRLPDAGEYPCGHVSARMTPRLGCVGRPRGRAFRQRPAGAERSRVRRDLRVVWLLPAVAFLVALLATGSSGRRAVRRRRDRRTAPAGAPAAFPGGAPGGAADAHLWPTCPSCLLPSLPRLRAGGRGSSSHDGPPLERAAPTSVPSPAPEVPAASAPSPRRPAPAPQPVAPAPEPVAPAPAPVTPAPEFDDSGSGPAFNDDGVSP